MKIILSCLFLVLTFICHAQSVPILMPRSYIERHNIKEVTLKIDSETAVAQYHFNKVGLLMRDSHFQKIEAGGTSDSICQVWSYEYDSTNEMISQTYFQYSIGTNTFPSVRTEIYSAMPARDSVQTRRYGPAIGDYVEYSNFNPLDKDVTFMVIDSIHEKIALWSTDDEVQTFKLSSNDSIVIRDESSSFNYRYAGIHLDRIWAYQTLGSIEWNLVVQFWFDKDGLPKKVWHSF